MRAEGGAQVTRGKGDAETQRKAWTVGYLQN